MSSRAKRGCGCIDKVQTALNCANSNTRLVTTIPLTVAVPRVILATERIEKLRDGKKAAVIAATFCPFCGKKYPK